MITTVSSRFAPAAPATTANVVKVITGDSGTVTAKVCRDIGVEVEALLTGRRARLDRRRGSGRRPADPASDRATVATSYVTRRYAGDGEKPPDF
jgi:hypothetical protein